MTAPGFWDNPEQAKATVAEAQQVKRWTQPLTDLTRRAEEAKELAELVTEDPDPDIERGLAQEVESLLSGLEQIELRNMLQGPDDQRDALMTIHPGAGGTESQDWAEMLMRMYTRWAEQKGFDVKLLDLLPGEEAGI